MFSLREKGEDEIHSDEEFDNYETIQRFVKSARHVNNCLSVGIMKYIIMKSLKMIR